MMHMIKIKRLHTTAILRLVADQLIGKTDRPDGPDLATQVLAQSRPRLAAAEVWRGREGRKKKKEEELQSQNPCLPTGVVAYAYIYSANTMC